MSIGLPPRQRATACRAVLARGLLLCSFSIANSCASRGPLPQEGAPGKTTTAQEDARQTVSHSTAPVAAAQATPATEAWKPPEPGRDGFDWIRLKSGEWLKGEFKYMRNKKVEFDSDELDLLTFDWEDVLEVRSPRPNSLLFDGRLQATGTVLVRDDVVLVGGEEPRMYPRDRLVSIVPGEEKESDYWSGKISVGATFRSGNTDQTDVTARGTIWRRTALTTTALDYTGSITTLDGAEEVNNHRLFASYSVFLTTRFYLTPAAVEYYKDRISNVRHRITPGAGAGYWVVDTPEIDWNVDLLGGYRSTEYETVEAGDDRIEETAAVIASTKVDWELTNDIDLIVEYRIDVGLNDLKQTNHHAVTTLSVDLTRILDLDVSLVWDRLGDPRPDDSGDVPKNDDFRLVVGLGVDF